MNLQRCSLHALFQGFSVEGQENLQEILSKQLLLCQFLTGLSIVRTGIFIIFLTLLVFPFFSKVKGFADGCYQMLLSVPGVSSAVTFKFC